MQPDSLAVTIIAWVVALGAWLAVAALGHRSASRTFRGFTSRLIAHALVAVLAITAVAATLNHQNSWYGNWSDLGSDLAGDRMTGHVLPPAGASNALTPYDPARTTRQDAVTQARFSALRATSDRRWRGVGHHSDGAYLTETVGTPIAGAAQGVRGKVLVWLPPSYYRHPERTYPVIEAFHGIPGGPDAFATQLPLMRMLITAMHRGQLREAIVVAPEYTPNGLDTECVDSPRIRMGQWLGQTVPDWVISHFRATSARAGWATFGYSAGGFCAAAVAMQHARQFGSAVVLGGYFRPIWSADYRPYGRRTMPQDNLIRVAHVNPPPINMYLEISGADKFSSPPSVQMRNQVRAPMSVSSVTYPDAGHRMSVWVDATPSALQWLGRTSPAFAPRRTSAA